MGKNSARRYQIRIGAGPLEDYILNFAKQYDLSPDQALSQLLLIWFGQLQLQAKSLPLGDTKNETKLADHHNPVTVELPDSNFFNLD